MKVDNYVEETIAVLQNFGRESSDVILEISKLCLQTFSKGGTLYLCGNGGSATQAQHVATEFVGRFLQERQALPAVSLCANTSLLTALANDYDGESIFARQVSALVTSKDVLVAISTSGGSSNILRAVQEAKKKGALTIGFSGKKTPQNMLVDLVDIALQVPSHSTPHIQEAHLMAWHMICGLVEQEFL